MKTWTTLWDILTLISSGSAGRHIAWLYVFALWPLLPAFSQESKPPKKERTAAEILREVDSKIWYGKSAGLKDLQFDYKIEASGSLRDVLEGLYLRCYWKPDLWKTELVDKKGEKALLPESLRNATGQRLVDQLSATLRQEVKQLVVGVPYSDLFKDYAKELKSRRVNNKIRHRIILRPRSKKRFVQQELTIADGFPVSNRRILPSGKSETLRFSYKKYEAKYLLGIIRLEENSRTLFEEHYRYVKKGGIHVLAGVERHLDKNDARSSGQPAKQVQSFERIRVNQGLKDSIFPKAKARPKTPTSKPTTPAKK